ncbi:amidohydrolase [Cladorrhinum sp. PSN259]|nr:amidohydrolase [Cladorrhinum sp. PSN259]
MTKRPIIPINQPEPTIQDWCDALATEQPPPPSDSKSFSLPLSALVEASKPQFTIINARLLIPGASPPIPNASLVIKDKFIAWVGPQDDLPKKYRDLSTAHRIISVPYLMPGLWDVHAHFDGEPQTGEPTANYLGILSTHPASAGARLTKGCWEALQRGYTSLRDVAGFGCEVAKAIEEGSIVGPNVYSSGACLSQTAGHGDVFPMPAGDVLLRLGVQSVSPGHFGANMCMLVDGVDECRKGVRLQIRRGAKVIKVFATGGVMSRDDDPLCAQFSEEELEVMVKEAARQGRLVAAHAHGKPGILAAVKAGVATVEHGSFADEECVELMKEKGTIFVSTRTVIEVELQNGGKGMAKENWDKLKLVATNHQKAYELAIKSGIPLALGTDTSPGFNMAVELEYAVKCGLSNLEAIKAATANGPLTVGPQAPLTGQLKEGYEADIIALAENPVEDVKVLQKPKNITWVWKGGKVFKGPGVGPWGEGYTLTDGIGPLNSVPSF